MDIISVLRLFNQPDVDMYQASSSSNTTSQGSKDTPEAVQKEDKEGKRRERSMFKGVLN